MLKEKQQKPELGHYRRLHRFFLLVTWHWAAKTCFVCALCLLDISAGFPSDLLDVYRKIYIRCVFCAVSFYFWTLVRSDQCASLGGENMGSAIDIEPLYIMYSLEWTYQSNGPIVLKMTIHYENNQTFIFQKQGASRKQFGPHFRLWNICCYKQNHIGLK